jgi:dolichyl-phosphate-mannose--protein O-mannosyl transferase
MRISLFIFSSILLIARAHISENEINETVEKRIITCGSILRIQNVMTKFQYFILINCSLHSHKLTWGSGSGQQSITAVQAHDDPNSLWIIKEAHGELPCETGTPIKCGQIIRFEHVNTGKNLHSHRFPSFVTDSQEVKIQIYIFALG